ncbi:B1 bradykinin receptor [Denticeps clupeoides]|uniref:B1 bradykinin receptor n=1 Tax=Denticeps clupeoides TaxID=299321 RepID=UPI0010A4A0CB|nr:B1 bradykinin receptor-like [Denticeps clupeoides]
MDQYQSRNSSDSSSASGTNNSADLDLVHTIVPPYIFILCTTGIIGNAFVLLVFLLQRGKWSVPEIYLGNLALADLIMLSLLPFWAINIMNNYEWPFGNFMCATVSLSITINMYTSIFLLAMISVDRFLALVQTMKARWLRRTRYAKAICVSLWISGIIMCLPILPYRKVKYDHDYNIMSCILDFPNISWRIAHHMLLNLMGFLLPFFIILFCSCNIAKSLRVRRDKIRISDRSDYKATVLVYAVTLLFLICWGPFHLFTFLELLCDFNMLDSGQWAYALDIGNQFSTYFAFLNSSLNPVLYVCSGQYFRRKISEIYRRRKHSRASDVTTMQRSVLTTYLLRTEQIKPVVI